MPRTRMPMVVGLVAVLAASACTSSKPDDASPTASPAPATLDPGPSCVKVEGGDRCLPLAPANQRIDLVKPSFTNPTSVTNTLFPVSKLSQYLQLGTVDGGRFRAEVTLLPGTKTIEWNGLTVTTLESQYVAYHDGRIAEVAIDWYAQADDGAVWYFGEDVFNYEDGILADTHGTWIAGKNGPPGMIMPATPKVGDVYRPENVPGVVFEEVTTNSVGQTVRGPRGPVAGAIVARELHMDGMTEDKTFAPGYGEFTTGSGANIETMALAVPIDALSTPTPAALDVLATAAGKAFDAAGKEDWAGAAAARKSIQDAWTAIRGDGVPELLATEMTRAVDALDKAVTAEEAEEARQAAVDIGQTALDLRLRHEPVATVDIGRLAIWGRQLLVDTAANEPGDVAGTAEVLQRIWDRVKHAVDPAGTAGVDSALQALRAAASRKDVAGAARGAPGLLAALGKLQPR